MQLFQTHYLTKDANVIFLDYFVVAPQYGGVEYLKTSAKAFNRNFMVIKANPLLGTRLKIYQLVAILEPMNLILKKV